MQSEIDEIRASLQVLRWAAVTEACTEAFLLEAACHIERQLGLIELQQKHVVLPVTTLEALGAAARAKAAPRLTVVQGGRNG